MARIVLHELEKAYPNGVHAIRDFSLEIADGEFLVLVGPSGCGKTTLLRMIAGLEMPTRGTITLGDRVVNGVRPKDRNIAMVFQNQALYPHLTVFGNMAFSLRMRGTPRRAIRHKVHEAAAMLGIEHLLDRRPRQLSGGEGQRVALGRALVRRPDCFLLDEPLSSLDAPLRAEMRAELKRLHQSLGITTLYVTHDQEEAMTLGRRIAVLHESRIQQAGEPLEVYRRPRNGFVAGFLGSPPMNFLRGTLVAAEGRLWFDDGEQRLPILEPTATRLAGRLGHPVILGIRPEALFEKPPLNQPSGAIQAKVELLEPLGDRTDVHLSTSRHPRIVARLDSRTQFSAGTTGTIYVDSSQFHFFGADSGAPNGVGERVIE